MSLDIRDYRTFAHDQYTNLALGRVNNRDFILLLLAQNGVMKYDTIRRTLFAWRGPDHPTFQTYFNKYYGHVALNFFDTIPMYGYLGSKKYARRRWWYRIRRGEYALTDAGMRRLRQLGIENLG